MVFDVGLPAVEIYNTQGPVHGNRCLEAIPVRFNKESILSFFGYVCFSFFTLYLPLRIACTTPNKCHYNQTFNVQNLDDEPKYDFH